MIKNQANIYQFVLRDMIGQGVTGLTPTVQIRKDSGSFTATTNTPTEVSYGAYEVILTATECNCDVMMFMVTLPDGQFPAILENERLITTGGATPAEIWGYTGGRTVTNTIPTAQNIWEYSSRTLTASALTAQQVWEYSGGRTLTASPTDISGLATSSDLSAVATNVSAVKAKTDNLPASPAAVGSEMALTSATITAVQNGLATSSELSALETHGDSSWATATGFTTPSDLSSLATEGDISSLASYGDTKWLTATGFATPSDIPTSDITAIKTKVDSLHNTDLTGVATALSVEKIHAGLFNWSLDEDVINAKNTSGTVIVSSTITRDSSGNITAMEEGND